MESKEIFLKSTLRGLIKMTSDNYNVHNAIMAQLDESKLTKSQKRELLCTIICELKPTRKELYLAARILGHIPHNGQSMRQMLDKLSKELG